VESEHIQLVTTYRLVKLALIKLYAGSPAQISRWAKATPRASLSPNCKL